MNKLFLLLLSAVLFAACSDNNGNGNDDHTPNPLTAPGVNTSFSGNWADSSDPNYKGEKYNPIADVWQVKKINGKVYNEYMYFGFYGGHYFAVSTTQTKEGEQPTQWTTSRVYGINGSQFRTTENSKIYEYKLTASPTGDDKLEVYDGRDRYELDLYRTSLNLDDWNDPFDRHYSLFNGNYNPVKGTWKATHENGLPISESEVFHYSFTEDFNMLYIQNNNRTENLGKYSINNKIFNTIAYHTYELIDNNTLKIQRVYLSSLPPDNSYTFIRVE